ncbi:MAG TPA: hypothetical protein PK051_04345, partial [Trichococcus flocculiformis]|nr:hypothetical protein [Trichococcus flocculiformis]
SCWLSSAECGLLISSPSDFMSEGDFLLNQGRPIAKSICSTHGGCIMKATKESERKDGLK